MALPLSPHLLRRRRCRFVPLHAAASQPYQIRLAASTASGAGSRQSENRTAVTKRAAPSTAFKPGQSGNPGGRPKALAEVQQLARAETAANIQALIRIRDAADSPPAAVVAAVSVMFDRAYGKPKQEFENTGEDGAPVRFVIYAPPPVATTQDWLRLHAPRDVIEGGAEDADPGCPPVRLAVE